MKEYQYRGYVIKVEAVQSMSTEYWEGRAYIQYHESGSFRSVPRYGPFNTFRTKDEAERHILEEAKQWVDGRIGS
jgi:hypothetical protein